MAIWTLSASQISTFRDCPRKWGFEKLTPCERLGSAATELGTEVHAQLETYLLGGDIDYSRDSGYIAATATEHLPHPPLPKKEVEREFAFQMRTPEGRDAHFLGFMDVATEEGVFDHKTTKNLQYAKTPEELAHDTQATIYAAQYFLGHPDKDVVRLQWTYATTRKPYKSLPVVYDAPAEAVFEEMRGVLKDADRMLAFVEAAPTPDEAGPYVLAMPYVASSCDKYGGCPFQSRCNLSPSEKMRSFMSQSSLLDSLRARTQGAAPAPAPQPINPPEQSPPIDEVPAPAPAPAPAPGPTAAEIAEADARAAAIRNAPIKTKPAKPAPAPKGFTLFVNCRPDKFEGIDVAALVFRAQDEITRSKGVADWRYLEYGQGPGLLATLVASYADGATDLVIDTKTPEGSVCLMPLTARAARVVRGF